jgi:phage-related protein
MPSIGARCHELRIPDEDGTWRLVYRIDGDAIILAEVFRKKSVQTPDYVVARCKDRYKRYDAAAH